MPKNGEHAHTIGDVLRIAAEPGFYFVRSPNGPWETWCVDGVPRIWISIANDETASDEAMIGHDIAGPFYSD